MDKAEPNKELTEDSTRESLIALSYKVPANEQPAATSPKDTSIENGCGSPHFDGKEKYRSELISISYSPSPDMEIRPLSPAELDEQRGVPRDVLLHRPYNAGGGAAAEAFAAADPDAEDAVKLLALARRRPLEDDFGGAWGGAVRRRCVGVEDRRLAVGEGEIVLEKEVGAWCVAREMDWFGEGGEGPKVMVRRSLAVTQYVKDQNGSLVYQYLHYFVLVRHNF
ncbi:hypothetical protein SASPL_102789 [Salvia splendens]|uniref:Uncharacterized protein n=1 Tax=Salvia splendens TaxID=180675 RepID=A0A8X8YU93_SALSN|nr:hypothetical protein SASPL_102789 [Salvia splendens]